MLKSEGIVNNDYIKDFLLGGRCECRIENIQSGKGSYYSLREGKKEPGNKRGLFFVYVHDIAIPSTYAGFLKLSDDGSVSFIKGSKGQLLETDVRVKALLYVLKNYKTLPPQIVVQHLGKCGRCNRTLTDPESIRRGLGPECAKKGV